jgi:hypothetical protein
MVKLRQYTTDRSKKTRCVEINGEPLALPFPIAAELLDLVVNAAMPVPSEWETVWEPRSRRSRICGRAMFDDGKF